MTAGIAEYRDEKVRLLGYSLAGEETFVVAPHMNLAFDIGRAPGEVVATDHVFLSHGHMDHAAGIGYYFSQRMFIDASPGHLYAPEQLVAPIGALLGIWADIDGHEPPAHVHAAVPGRDVELRRDLTVRPFLVNHPCRRHDRSIVHGLGYAAIEVRYKLKNEYQGLTGVEIVALKKKGVKVTRRVELPLVAYCGDTAPGDFLDLDYVRNAHVLLLECTFVERGHENRARAGYHFHVSDLRDVVPRLNNERILLTHLSRRTHLADAKDILRRELSPAADERVDFLMSFHRRGRRDHRRDTSAAPQS